MSYIGVTLNHFRALQDWGIAHQAELRLDMKTFRVDVEWEGARCQLHPQFLNGSGSSLSYATVLSPSVSGFIGWLPYRPLRWPLSSDKLAFKGFLAHNQLRTPGSWKLPGNVDQNHLLKLPVGSFGQAVFGPYRAGVEAWKSDGHAARLEQGLFAEQFVVGRNLKVWFWGDRPFHAHLHERPVVAGDGASTIEALVATRLGRLDRRVPETADRPWLVSSLAFQGLGLDSVLPIGQEAWIEFRYGRLYADSPIQAHSDSDLDALSLAVRTQVERMGACMHDALTTELGLPVLYALDAVVDASDEVWWLEANSNPILPPTGYGPMLASLFDIRYRDPAPSSMALASAVEA
ncbi:hypothetical protein ACEN9J_11330 [Variovorax sp. Varisp41]|uniref:hypothetical protein n=1 Tax=unclassified Variovorax TaxID=663243 RepID=UPI0039B6C57A